MIENITVNLSFINVVAMILIKNEQVLVAQRPKHDRLAYLWEFPGGKMEKNETPESALKREIKEELGLNIVVGSHFKTVEMLKQVKPFKLHAYFAELIDGRLELNFHSKVKWIHLKELSSLSFAPADIPIVNALQDIN